ncbi:Glycosyltransferase involved in cell wall bisynthesis [Rhizobium sp. NFR07]|uniref:glycosyltransferase n=1 Tax=Rhizobium sp. NFR07 TaxID=1566262 RepID=UPI0008EAC932|nr:glycosyltransferase [Rhizobium sp. NFR07]SFB62926.1 Glycosyltransferase involved in cell wall bisynthesis [Rhizobium sp. NFR07]
MNTHMRSLNVYVHLAAGHDAEQWRHAFEQRSLVGVNDPSPYGYARANEMGCKVSFSEPAGKGRATEAIRLALRLLLGFDYVHAKANRDRILSADVIWTHTESQFLAVAMLLANLPKGAKRPKLIGQAVWLFDKWPSLWPVHRWLYRKLIREVDILTVHSPDNELIAKSLFPEKKIEFVRFGIPNEAVEPVRARQTYPLRVLCVGNDRHRDWQSAVAALGDQEGIELIILSSTASASLAKIRRNVKVTKVDKNEDLTQALRQASLMLVPLKQNVHASGITVVQEAALFGLPIIASDTGGLRAYFDDDAVCYVRPEDPAEILRQVRRLAADPPAMQKQALRAQARMGDPDMGCAAYIRRHVEMTKSLLSNTKRAS